MEGIRIRSCPSEAEVVLRGAYVASLTLDGLPAIKPGDDQAQTHGGIAVLIPYAGRVRAGRYTFDGKTFRLPVEDDGHAIHGFAKDESWRVVTKKTDSVALGSRLKGAGYPGVLAAQLTYTVGPASFSTDCIVKNLASRNCPFMAGFHPYFLAGDWKIIAPGRAYRYVLVDKYFPTGERKAFSFSEVRPETPLDDSFEVSGKIILQDAERSLVMTRRNMPYLVVYNGEYAGTNSVAVEPYTGLEDTFNNGIGLVVLKPGESFAFGYKVSIGAREGVHSFPSSRPSESSDGDDATSPTMPPRRSDEKGRSGSI